MRVLMFICLFGLLAVSTIHASIGNYDAALYEAVLAIVTIMLLKD